MILSNTNNFQTDLFDSLVELTGTNTWEQSGTGSNGNEGVFYTPWNLFYFVY